MPHSLKVEIQDDPISRKNLELISKLKIKLEEEIVEHSDDACEYCRKRLG